MGLNTFTQAVLWVTIHGYLLVFLAMVVEGPTVTAAAAFASALGYFNVVAVFALSVLADLVADGLYYAIGFWGRVSLVEKYGKYFGITKKRIERLENLLHKNAWKTLIAIKITPGLPTPGLIIAGGTKFPLRQFITISLIITLPKSLLFVLLGYYSGRVHLIADKTFHYSQYAIFLIFVVIVLGSYIYQKVSKIIAERIEKL